MGLTTSSENIKFSCQPTVQVITPDGSLRESTTSVSASDLLVNAGETHFLCNSDNLYFDSEITAVDPTKLLQLGQLYFILPISMLGNVLSGIDMVSLAVKASSALAQSNSNSRRRTSSGTRRVAPDSIRWNENAKLNQRINEKRVMVSGTRSSAKADEYNYSYFGAQHHWQQRGGCAIIHKWLMVMHGGRRRIGWRGEGFKGPIEVSTEMTRQEKMARQRRI